MSTTYIMRPSRGIQSVTVEYDGKNGQRESKTFNNTAARRFYIKMSYAGKNPKIVAAVR